jgi:hypothetical protein
MKNLFRKVSSNIKKPTHHQTERDFFFKKLKIRRRDNKMMKVGTESGEMRKGGQKKKNEEREGDR